MNFKTGAQILRNNFVLKNRFPCYYISDVILEKIFDEASLEMSQGKAHGDTIDWNKSMKLIKRTEEVLPELKAGIPIRHTVVQMY